MSHSVLQRRYVEMEAKSRETERELEEVKMERGRLKGERCVLYEGEAHERQVGEDREKEWSEERASRLPRFLLVSILLYLSRK